MGRSLSSWAAGHGVEDVAVPHTGQCVPVTHLLQTHRQGSCPVHSDPKAILSPPLSRLGREPWRFSKTPRDVPRTEAESWEGRAGGAGKSWEERGRRGERAVPEAGGAPAGSRALVVPLPVSLGRASQP